MIVKKRIIVMDEVNFSLKIRENALRTLQILFSHNYLPEQITNRYENKK